MYALLIFRKRMETYKIAESGTSVPTSIAYMYMHVVFIGSIVFFLCSKYPPKKLKMFVVSSRLWLLDTNLPYSSLPIPIFFFYCTMTLFRNILYKNTDRKDHT